MDSLIKSPHFIKGFKKGSRIVALLLPSTPIGLIVKITLILFT